MRGSLRELPPASNGSAVRPAEAPLLGGSSAAFKQGGLRKSNSCEFHAGQASAAGKHAQLGPIELRRRTSAMAVGATDFAFGQLG